MIIPLMLRIFWILTYFNQIYTIPMQQPSFQPSTTSVLGPFVSSSRFIQPFKSIDEGQKFDTTRKCLVNSWEIYLCIIYIDLPTNQNHPVIFHGLIFHDTSKQWTNNNNGESELVTNAQNFDM